MAQDTYETPVLFREHMGEVTAVFPCEVASYYCCEMTCYAHIGQHGACSFTWYNKTKAAKPEAYASLKTELESIGYKLKVYKRMQPWMREVFRDEQQRLVKGIA